MQNKLRKWILKWLFGSEVERFYKALKLTDDCYEGFKKAYETNERLVQDYKELSETYLEILEVGSEVNDSEEFRWKVIEILKNKRSVQMDGEDVQE